jgi:broad specificity phosphatase PhoE
LGEGPGQRSYLTSHPSSHPASHPPGPAPALHGPEAELRARTELWLLRHGESTGNRDGVLQGQADLPLSPLGQTQARRLAERLRGHRFGALYASDLQRARDTALAIAGAVQLSLREDPALREIDTGTWSGLTAGEISAKFPAEWQAWQRRDPHMRRGGGESYAEAAARITRALEAIAGQHPGERVLVVGHGAVFRLYLTGVLGMPLDTTWHLAVGNASISRVRPFAEAFDGERPLVGRVLAINDVAHLEHGHAQGASP